MSVMCKTQFGSAFQRLLRGGVRLYPVEERLIERFILAMPDNFQVPLQQQLNAFNLAQREVDGRALNLYRIKGGQVFKDNLPPLPCHAGEVKLWRCHAGFPDGKELHVVFTAVDRVFFGITTDQDIRPFRDLTDFTVNQTKQSWRSNLEHAS